MTATNTGGEHADAFAAHPTTAAIDATIKALDGKVAADKVSVDEAMASFNAPQEPTDTMAAKDRAVADAFDSYVSEHVRDDNDRVGKPTVPRVPLLRDPEYDRFNRYTLIAPNGKLVKGSRASQYPETFEDTFSLNRWKQGCVLRGAARRPDLIEDAATLDPSKPWEKKRLHTLVAEAEKAGGSKTAADKGTDVHAYCEALDTGVPGALGNVPAVYRDDVAAYVVALLNAGITVVPDMVERTTWTHRWAPGGIAGTFDNVLRRYDGTYVIGDKKTGKINYGPVKIYAQLVSYATGFNENGVYDKPLPGEERPPGTWTDPGYKVDEDSALIVHLPVGQGLCVLYEADMNAGRTHLDRCARVRKERNEKHNLRTYTPPEFEPRTEVERTAWAHALERAASKPEASLLWKIMDRACLVDDDVKSLAIEVNKRLTDLS